MCVIRVDASTATILLTEAPAPKVRDRQTGEIAKDAVTGEALMTVGVVYIDEGESSLVQVTVPESGVTEGLTVGAPRSRCQVWWRGRGRTCSTARSGTASPTGRPPLLRGDLPDGSGG